MKRRGLLNIVWQVHPEVQQYIYKAHDKRQKCAKQL